MATGPIDLMLRWSESAKLLVGSVTMCPGHVTLNGPQLCVTGFWGLCYDSPVGAAGLHVVDHHQLPPGPCSLRARQQACASPDPSLNKRQGKQDPKRARETAQSCASLSMDPHLREGDVVPRPLDPKVLLTRCHRCPHRVASAGMSRVQTTECCEDSREGP